MFLLIETPCKDVNHDMAVYRKLYLRIKPTLLFSYNSKLISFNKIHSNDNIMIDNNYLKSLEKLFEDKKWHIENPLLKFKKMQDIYLSKNVAVYTNNQVESITKCYEAVYHKFFLTCLSSEQLWSMSESIRLKIFYHLDNLRSICLE